MNILIAADYSPPQSGSFGASVLEIGLYLKEKGDCLTVILPKNNNTVPEGSWANWIRGHGIAVYLYDRKENPDELAYLLNIISEHKIDVLHLHFDMFLGTVIKHRKLLPKKVLLHDHMCFGKLEGNTLGMKLKHLAKSAYFRMLNLGVISVGKEKNAVYAFAKHWYLPNGLTFRRNIAESLSREQCRAALGIGPEEKTVLVLGWHCYYKGIDIAMKALDKLNREGHRILLCYVGIGNPPSQSRVQFIRERAGVDPFADWIRYLPSTEDMYAYHRMTDVYLSSSRGEGFSFAALEAISQGTSLVLSDIPGTRWAWNYSKAHVYPVESADACAEAVLKALQTEDKTHNGAELVEKYSIEDWCSGLYRIYKEC